MNHPSPAPRNRMPKEEEVKEEYGADGNGDEKEEMPLKNGAAGDNH